jgi:hypothetical protein
MKKCTFLSIVIVLIACNNTASNKVAKYDSSAATGNKNSAAMNFATGSCTNLILFHKGAVIDGKTYDGQGKETGSQTTTITDVNSNNGITVAEADIKTRSVIAGDLSRHVKYKCDGKNLYMDLSELLSGYTLLKDAKVNAEALEFPVNLHSGQQLRDATISIEMKRKEMNIKTTATHKNRKVESKEIVTTTAGTWNCFKITSDIETTVDMGKTGPDAQKVNDAMKQSRPKLKSIIWFADDFGLVKMEMYSGDNLMSRSLITGAKK